MHVLTHLLLLAITAGYALPQDCNEAIVSDGSGASVELPGTFGGVGELTVEAWVRCNPSISGFQTIVGPGSGVDLVHLQLATFGNCAIFHDQGYTLLPVLAPSAFEGWHHVALSIQSGNTRLYRDGVEIGSSTDQFGSLNNNALLWVGRNAQTNRFLDGAVDELRVWSTARTQQEIQSTMSLRLDAAATSGMSSLICNISFEGSALDLASGQLGVEQGPVYYENADGFLTNSICDCNQNGVADAEDIATGASLDCNGNGLPDECEIAAGEELDCNANGIPDSCDITSGSEQDCNVNGIPDSCELLAGTALDCNANGVPDECDIAAGAADCNADGVPDSCQILADATLDLNSNGILDSCEAIGTTYCSPAVGNSTGLAGEVTLLGSELIVLNQFFVSARQLPPNSFGFFIASTVPGSINPVPNSQGTLCVIGDVGRGVGGGIFNAGLAGAHIGYANLLSMPQPNGPIAVLAGETWNFQAWYRDAIGGQTTSNFTDAVAVTFQ